MEKLESINRLLAIAAQQLDQAAKEMRDSKFEPIQVNIERIGRALAEISKLQHSIYEKEPSLKPEYLNEVSPNPEADRL